MILGDPNGGCWPNELQVLLLKAALFEGEAAGEAYCEWRGRGGLEALDAGSYRLLPLVGHNLARYGFEHQDMGMLRGLRRKTWSENRLMFASLAPTVDMIQKAGIPVVLLKGVPLAVRYYSNPGLRPMRDLDVLVPEERAWDAKELLEAAGWSLYCEPHLRFGPRDLGFRQALGFTSAGRELDLHWHALYQATFPGADVPFLEAAESLEFEMLTVRALCPSDELLHALVHGSAWNEIPPVRWVADAMTIMRTAPIDWDRLVRLTRNLHVTLPVRAASEYLVRVFQAPIPEHTRNSLAALRADLAERVEFEKSQKPWQADGALELVQWIYASYRRGVRGRSVSAQVAAFPRFVRFFINATSYRELWIRAAMWAARRISHYPAGRTAKGISA
jgi:hypothetical protein